MWRKCLLAAILLGACTGSVTVAELYRYQNEAGIKVVDWAIPAVYVGSGYEVLNESGQIVRVVPPAKTDTELERDAVAARAQEAEAAAQAAQLERDTFLLRRYSTIQDIEAARDRSLRELDIRIAILSGQRDTLSQQLARHQSALDTTERSGAVSPQYEEETVAALKAEIQSLDEASEGRQQQAAALAEAYSRDIARFAELEEIVALRRQMSVTPPSP
ncbi:MAG: hypothetical protein ISQ66_07300 [Luminiphilus sp.]|nr:hypothetical protein [Luminiphilus sp.]